MQDTRNQTLQVRVGKPKGLARETYREMRLASIDEGKTMGQVLEEAWAALQQTKRAGIKSVEGAASTR